MGGHSFHRNPGGTPLTRTHNGTGLALNYATERQGSLTGLLGPDGQLDNAYGYDEWGAGLYATGPRSNPYRYHGTYLDGASGLYQMGARYYSAKQGRFTQQDPVDGWSYHYANSNPVNYEDPEGLCPSGQSLSGNCSGASPGATSGVVRTSPPPTPKYVQPTLPGIGGGAPGGPKGTGSAYNGGSFPPIKPGSAGGPTAGKDFSDATRQQALQENPQQVCVYCRMTTSDPEIDHATPKSRGGNATLDNAQ